MKEFAEKLTGLTWDDLSPQTVQAAKWTLTDTLGAIIFGNGERENRSYAESVSATESGSISVLGTPFNLTLREAAFVNGCGSVATEMDEGNQWSKGHPAAHVIPALLTYVQTKPSCSGKELLTAIVGGYEACSRYGRAVTLLPAAHAHGTWGSVGTAAGVMLLERMTAEQFADGVQLAASFALPTMWTAALEGALIRNAYTGHATEAGVRIPAMLRAGFRAPQDADAYIYGKVLGTAFDSSQLLDEIDDGKWDIERNYFKPYAFCRYAHAPIDAFGELLDSRRFAMDEAEKIEVLTYSRAATLNNRDPHNVLSAKFSIPYALAVRIFTGKADQHSFADELLHNEDIRSFAKLVEVKFVEELELNYPTDMPAVVRVTLKSGEQLEARCDMAQGGPGRPIAGNELTGKFKALTGRALSSEQQEQILDFIEHLEEQPDATALIRLCQPELVNAR